MDQELQTYAKKKRSHRVWRTLLTVLIVCAALGTAGFFLAKYYLVVREISVQPSALYAQEDMTAALAVEDKTPFILLSKKDLAESLTSHFPYLVNVSVSYDLPHTLSVSFEEKYGEIAYFAGADLFALSTDLDVIAREEASSTIPRIRLYCDGVSRCVVGEKIRFFEDDVKDLVQNLIDALQKTDFLQEAVSIDVRDKFNVRVNIAGRFAVLLGENEDFYNKLALVRAVTKDLAEGETATIDAADSNNAFVSLGTPNF